MNKSLFTQLGISAALVFASPLHAALYNVTVAQDGSGDYKTIQEALANAPQDDSLYTIYIKNGTYQERLNIERPNLYFIGESQTNTIITATTASGTQKDDGSTWGTTGSRTVNINAENFKARNLTIANGFDYPANQEKADDDPTKIKSTQAVALLISKPGNHAQFKNVTLEGYQDTLYLKSPMNYFDQSKISGHIDFIFGYGGALIENSEIIARDRNDVSEGNSYGYITAPATDINQAFGLVFKSCHLKKENPKMPAKSFALGRPWHPTTTFEDGRYADPNAIGHAAFINCRMDDHIYGWDKMSGKDINQNTIWFTPEQSRFWEYHNFGAGAVPPNQPSDAYRPQLTHQQIKQYDNDTILDGWTPDISLPPHSNLQGEVLNSSMSFPAIITAIDSSGQKVIAKTDKQGRYELSISKMTLPIVVSANDLSGFSCLKSDKKRSFCMSALITDAKPGETTLGNINPFTDVIVSGLANSVGIDGPQQLVEKGYVPVLPLKELEQARANFQQAFSQAFEQRGMKDTSILSPENYDKKYHSVMKKLTEKVLHNRGYTTSTGLASATTLTDLAFHPILNIESNPKYQLQDDQLDQVAHQIKSAKTRVFLVGDSTVSNYEQDVYPRMGWGQAFDLQYSDRDLAIVNAARSGRSSRDFINGRWLSSLEPYVKPGDYLFIEFSHNDEKCNGANGERGPIDVANLCTYPNSEDGKPQYPFGKPHYSFQHSLERYLAFAKKHKMQPVLLTATARAKTAAGEYGAPINPLQHVTKQNSSNGYGFFGSYTQTVIDTAKKHNVPLIDMQAESIRLGDEAGSGWSNIWLAVDPAQYPYYEGRTGSLEKPDTTHFQQYGAQELTKVVVDYIKQEPKLKKLARQL
ncbi:pectinesterase family protein [Vibrio gangliei]|uniref:pectinesterase family protein n=1 Tax=Vibrio gangliei TaxID=2077090 RepID=UPI000D01DE8C|nr:pectinesterase family protein [Vibrio gangliei]